MIDRAFAQQAGAAFGVLADHAGLAAGGACGGVIGGAFLGIYPGLEVTDSQG